MPNTSNTTAVSNYYAIQELVNTPTGQRVSDPRIISANDLQSRITSFSKGKLVKLEPVEFKDSLKLSNHVAKIEILLPLLDHSLNSLPAWEANCESDFVNEYEAHYFAATEMLEIIIKQCKECLSDIQANRDIIDLECNTNKPNSKAVSSELKIDASIKAKEVQNV